MNDKTEQPCGNLHGILWIDRLKDNLTRKILALQPSKKKEANQIVENTLENPYPGN